VGCKTDPTPQQQVDFKRTGNSVAVQLNADVRVINPVVANSIYDMQVVYQVYSYLAGYTLDGATLTPELLKSIPEIRTEDDSSKPGRYAVDFEILEEAVWPNGSPVTGLDYEFMMKTVFNPLVNAIRYRGQLTGVLTGIEIDGENPKKFTVYADEVSILTLENLVNTLPVVPAYVGDPEGTLEDIQLADLLDPDKAEALASSNQALQDFAEKYNSTTFQKEIANIVGSGPYSVVDWVDGQRVTLQRKSDWWGDKVSEETHPLLVAYPDEIVYKPIADPNTALAALKAEEIDALSRFSPAEFESMQADSTGLRYDLEAVNSFSWFFISINTDNPKLSDKRVRKALTYAFDVNEILNKLFLGYGTRVTSPVHPTQVHYNEQLKLIEQDFDQAKSLLAEAGWEDTNDNGIVDKEIEGERVELSLEFTASPRETSKNMGLIFKESARQIGVEVEVVQAPISSYFSKWRNKEYELFSAGSSITPVWNPRQSWHSEGDNRTGFGNADTDALIDEILVTLDENKRMQLYNELQTIIADEQPVIFLFTPKTTVAVHDRFEWTPLVSPPCFDPRFFKLKESFQ
ncbi:MAG: ABC transporter substrate-binding protein, partial [Bacteroidota bacterium]